MGIRQMPYFFMDCEKQMLNDRVQSRAGAFSPAHKTFFYLSKIIFLVWIKFPALNS